MAGSVRKVIACWFADRAKKFSVVVPREKKERSARLTYTGMKARRPDRNGKKGFQASERTEGKREWGGGAVTPRLVILRPACSLLTSTEEGKGEAVHHHIPPYQTEGEGEEATISGVGSEGFE